MALPILPFLEIPHKTLVIPALALFGELLTLAVIAILGKEYWGKIKHGARQLLRRPGSDHNDNG
ncbi:transporter suffix domain-containing protein [Pseudomonas piscis]